MYSFKGPEKSLIVPVRPELLKNADEEELILFLILSDLKVKVVGYYESKDEEFTITNLTSEELSTKEIFEKLGYSFIQKLKEAIAYEVALRIYPTDVDYKKISDGCEATEINPPEPPLYEFYCPNCGKRIDEDDSSCYYCGQIPIFKECYDDYDFGYD